MRRAFVLFIYSKEIPLDVWPFMYFVLNTLKINLSEVLFCYNSKAFKHKWEQSCSNEFLCLFLGGHILLSTSVNNMFYLLICWPPTNILKRVNCAMGNKFRKCPFFEQRSSTVRTATQRNNWCSYWGSLKGENWRLIKNQYAHVQEQGDESVAKSSGDREKETGL